MEHRTRKAIFPKNLNFNGTLFGGQALAWIDEEAAIFCACQLETTNLVTVKMSEVNFRNPARLGDVITIGCELVKMGRTSITVRCEIRNKTTGKLIVSVDEIVFVCVSENGHSVPHGKT